MWAILEMLGNLQMPSGRCLLYHRRVVFWPWFSPSEPCVQPVEARLFAVRLVSICGFGLTSAMARRRGPLRRSGFIATLFTDDSITLSRIAHQPISAKE